MGDNNTDLCIISVITYVYNTSNGQTMCFIIVSNDNK